jgi:hypothetical protein
MTEKGWRASIHAPLTRRQVFLTNREPGLCVGWLEDENHHFGVSVRHRDGVVLDARGASPRHPWSTCEQAPSALRTLIGRPLVGRAWDLGGQHDMRAQCTHLFELAALVSAHASAGGEDILYDAQVHTPDQDVGPGPRLTTATLAANSTEVLQWSARGMVLERPAEEAGRDLFQGFRPWLEGMPPARAQAAFVLRRAHWLHVGRIADLDDFETAAELGLGPVCFTFQPHRAGEAARMRGGWRDYASKPHEMLRFRDSTP